MRSMKLFAYAEPLCEAVEEAPAPRGTEVRVRITHCGVCHSDVHVRDGYFDLGGGNRLDVSRGRQLPFTLGHEIEGVVDAIGPDAEGVAEGRRIAVFPWIGCGECPVCRRGQENLCYKPRQLGINVDGGFSTHVMVPHPRYLIDCDGVPEGLAATYMCSGITAFGAMKKLGTLGPGDPVLVIGAGGVGMMGIQFARALFGQGPLVADIRPEGREAALKAGARAAYDSADPEALKRLMADTGDGCHGVVDFVGSEASMAFATKAVRRGGQIVVVGLFGGGFSMPIPMFPIRAISVGGSFCGNLEETREMMALVKAGKVAPVPLSTRPLDAAEQTLQDLAAGRVVGRVVLTP